VRRALDERQTDARSFGSVVKARNRLDGNLYAIKRIRLPSDPSVEVKVLREVTIFSKMAHPHIVRYHSSCVRMGDHDRCCAGGSSMEPLC